MTVNHLDEEAIFDIARRIESADLRADYLQQVCAHNTALLERVNHLLTIHDGDREFLEAPPADVGPTALRSLVTECPGMVIGNYKLLQQIGEGGFGIVFMAEQTHPIRRKVALKVIKPGMDTKEVIARFEAERQALALMDHPNIAMVLDAGSTESGRPYFVMELIRGKPLTEFCDANSVDVQQRLSLFQTVCRAVQHAHQKGVIHRDLKPSNILVTMHDGEPQVKIIDFGVAKALNHRLTERTLFTGFGQIVGTPQYMSPEQAELSNLEVDTRSDVYALGVLLYELVSGQPPFDSETLRKAGFDEMRRIIREQEPLKPSTRFHSLDEQSASQIACNRHTDPRQLGKAIQGDLDYVVMKALEKNRNRRYDTPIELAKDVQRHLNNEPVEAGPPTLSYRLCKYTSKHRGLVISVSVVTLSLLTTLVVSLGLLGIIASKNRRLHSTLVELEVKNRKIEEQIHVERENQQLRELEQARRSSKAVWETLRQVRRAWSEFDYGAAIRHADLANTLARSLPEGTQDYPDIGYWNLAVTYRMLEDHENEYASFRNWVATSFSAGHPHRESHRLLWAAQLALEGHDEESRAEFDKSEIEILLETLDSGTGAFTKWGRWTDRVIAVTYLCAKADRETDSMVRQQLLEKAAEFSSEEPQIEFCRGLVHMHLGEIEQAVTCLENQLEEDLGDLVANLANHPVSVHFADLTLRCLTKAWGYLGDTRRSEKVLQGVMAAFDKKLPSWHPANAKVRLQYGNLMADLERTDEAEKMILSAYEILNGYELASRDQLALTGERLIRLYMEHNDPVEARKWRERLSNDLAKRERTQESNDDLSVGPGSTDRGTD